MKFAVASTLLFATLALASPAPVAQPEAAVPAAAQPLKIAHRAPLHEREPAPGLSPEVEARAAGIKLDAREPKKGTGAKPKGGKNNTGAATTMTPSRVLELGALGLGVMEVVRLWA